ncbi:hypothetical protein ABIC37_004133 [Priestia megaterium]
MSMKFMYVSPYMQSSIDKITAYHRLLPFSRS